MNKLSSRITLAFIGLDSFSWKSAALLFLFLGITSQVNAQAQSTGKSFVPAQGVSRVTIEPDAFGIVTVAPVTPTVIPLGLNRYGGPTAINASTKQMSANRIVLPPGARGPRNLHKGADSILMIIQGNLSALIGADGEKTLLLKTGEFLYVPGDVWHQWVNASKTEEVTFVEIRADADDSSNVEIIPTP